MRVARSFMPSTTGVFHVYSRGVDKRQIFHNDSDKTRFVDRLNRYASAKGVTVLGRCLMPNHIHLMVKCESIADLSAMLHQLLTAYAAYYNRKYDRTGHLFQGRFRSKPVETDEYYGQLIKYISANPAGDPDSEPWLNIERDRPTATTPGV